MNPAPTTCSSAPTPCEQFAAIDGVTPRALGRLMALDAMKGIPTNPLAGWTTRLWQVGDVRVDYDAAADRLRVRSGNGQTLHDWSEAVSPSGCTTPPLRFMRLYWNDDVWRRWA